MKYEEYKSKEREWEHGMKELDELWFKVKKLEASVAFKSTVIEKFRSRLSAHDESKLNRELNI